MASPGQSPPPEEASKLAKIENDLIDLCKGCSLIVFDTMFTMDEYRQRPHWGHSAPEHAVDVARRAGVGRLVLYHHAPGRTDAQVDEVLEETRRQAPDLEIIAAAEMSELEV